MAGYSDTKQMIINALTGRPEGTKIQPEDHQAFALQIVDYIRSVELVAGNATPIGFADADTVPVQPYNGQAVYLSLVSGSNTVTFTNFIDQNGNAISVTSTTNVIKLITLLWNGQYWSSQVISVNAVCATDGYLFMGVATKDTSPNTPNTKVFYIADGKGVYTNFDGISVTEDEVVILYYDTAWHKEVTGIASNDKLTELQSGLAEKQNIITDLESIRDGANKGSTALQAHQDISHLLPKIDFTTYETKTDDKLTELQSGLAEKQNIITDLESIRDGANKGSTALQAHQDISHLLPKIDFTTYETKTDSQIKALSDRVDELDKGEVFIMDNTLVFRNYADAKIEGETLKF